MSCPDSRFATHDPGLELVMSEQANKPDAEAHDARVEERDVKIEEIARRLGVRAERGRRFAELTSLRVGGEIDWLLVPETEEQAAGLTGALDEADVARRGQIGR